MSQKIEAKVRDILLVEPNPRWAHPCNNCIVQKTTRHFKILKSDSQNCSTRKHCEVNSSYPAGRYRILFRPLPAQHIEIRYSK